MREVQAAGARIAVREWGEETGRPVLFWHALGPSASGEAIAEAAPPLVARGFRVLALDGPGFGASPTLPPDRYELDSLLALLDALADELRLERFAFMGHSWGGSIAVHQAARRPRQVEALVLLDSGHVDYGALPDVDPGRPLQAWVDDARARPWRWPSEQAFAAELAAAVQRWSPELLHASLAGLHRENGELVGSSPEARGAAFRGLAAPRQSDAWPHLREHDVPVLLLLSTLPPHVEVNERFVSAFIQAVPHADVRWIPNAGHGLLADAGPALGEQIADWLAQTIL
jgi:pimeloyl-ACP methyl ester carboxylesterase